MNPMSTRRTRTWPPTTAWRSCPPGSANPATSLGFHNATCSDCRDSWALEPASGLAFKASSGFSASPDSDLYMQKDRLPTSKPTGNDAVASPFGRGDWIQATSGELSCKKHLAGAEISYARALDALMTTWASQAHRERAQPAWFTRSVSVSLLVSAQSAFGYHRHRPQQTLLYQLVEQHVPACCFRLGGQWWKSPDFCTPGVR